MSTAAYYIPPDSLIINVVVFLLLSLLPVVETVALVRAPRIAGQRSWRQWFALAPLLAALASLTITVLFFIVYLRLASDPQYTPTAFQCVPSNYGYGTCQPSAPNANITQAFQLYQSLGSVFIWVLLAVYVVAVAGFLALAIGRRQRATPAAVASPDDAPSPATTPH